MTGIVSLQRYGKDFRMISPPMPAGSPIVIATLFRSLPRCRTLSSVFSIKSLYFLWTLVLDHLLLDSYLDWPRKAVCHPPLTSTSLRDMGRRRQIVLSGCKLRERDSSRRHGIQGTRSSFRMNPMSPPLSAEGSSENSLATVSKRSPFLRSS